MIYEIKYGGYEYEQLLDYYNSERNSVGLESVNNVSELIELANKRYKYVKS